MSKQYDPKTKTWKDVADLKEDKGTKSKITKNTTNKTGGSNLTNTNTDNSTSTGSAEQEYNTIEINTLQGTVAVVPTEANLKVNVGDCVSIKGVGKSLSGTYYVKEVNLQISSSGISLTWTVTKTDFGSSLKLRGS